MKVCFLIPEYVTDYYGRSAFCLMHECSRFDSTINEFDASCDIVFSTCFLDSKMGRLYSKIKKSHPEKIFINYLWDLPFWRADPQREQKSLFSIRGLISTRPYPLLFKPWRDQYEYYIKSGDVLLCSSEHTRNEVKKFYGVDSEVLHLYFPSADIKQDGLASERGDQIVYVGRIEEYKRVDILIRAVAKLEMPPKLVIVGRGSKQEECERLARELNVTVEFKGHLERQEMQREVGRSKIFVSPSIMEGNPGWGPCEAVWGGTPAIMADIPETREFFADGAVYFRQDDPKSLAEKLALLLRDSALRGSVLRHSRENISFYSLENGIERLEDFSTRAMKLYSENVR